MIEHIGLISETERCIVSDYKSSVERQQTADIRENWTY